jgi:hypothetical protein
VGFVWWLWSRLESSWILFVLLGYLDILDLGDEREREREAIMVKRWVCRGMETHVNKMY